MRAIDEFSDREIIEYVQILDAFFASLQQAQILNILFLY